MSRSKQTSESIPTPNEPSTPPNTPRSTLASRLYELVSACFTGLWVQTSEPQEAIHVTRYKPARSTD